MNYSYREQLQVLENLILKENSTKRLDCPFCLGKNTFTITNLDGDVLWNCYKASCLSKGTKKGSPSIDSIRNRLNRIPNQLQQRLKNEIPDILSDPLFHPDVVDWLEKNNCLEQLKEKKVKIKYSPKEKRILFFYPGDSGALGRTLIPKLKPKWKAFGDTSGLFITGFGDTVVLVEDCASAVSVSRLPGVIGIALSGTNISSKQKHLLTSYNTIKIALDKDASISAISLLGIIKPFCNGTVVLLDTDLKYLSINELRSKLKENLCNDKN